MEFLFLCVFLQDFLTFGTNLHAVVSECQEMSREEKNLIDLFAEISKLQITVKEY